MADLDNFEFKPLTEGLGIQRKSGSNEPTEGLKARVEGALDPFLGLPDLSFRRSPIEGRYSSSPSTEIPRSAVDKVLSEFRTAAAEKTPKSSSKEVLLQGASLAKDKEPSSQPLHRFVPTTHNLLAVIVDTLIIGALFLAALICLVLITEVNPALFFQTPLGENVLTNHILVVFVFSLIYLVVTRLMMGATIGEWTFDQKVGRPQDRNSNAYLLKVLARSLIVLGSGFLTFPILSWLIGQDLVGKWVRAQIFVKKA